MRKEVLTLIRKTCMWALAPIGMLAVFSCQDDWVAERQPVATGDEIAFAVAGDSTWTAISRSEKKMSRHFITMIGKDSVFLQVVEEKNTDMPFEQQDDKSRSASFTTENLKSFSLQAYYNNAEQFMMNQVVNKGDDGNWTYSPVKYWPNNPGDVISFYGYARYNDNGTFSAPVIDKEEKSGSFSYTLPTADKNDTDKNDAVNQPDLIFAITPDQQKPTVTDKVELVFHHALSAILFKVGEMPDNVTITDISLENVSTSGDCSYRLATEEDVAPEDLKPGDIVFDWTKQNGDGTYTQTFGKTIEEDKMISGIDDWFMMIPQKLDKVILSVSFRIGQKDYNLKYALKDLPQAWEADTKYTYVISTSGEVEVEVNDQVTPTVKSNVKIQNTGLATSYIRATIVGYWVNASGDIVAPWEFVDSQGTITWGDNWGSNWEQRTDGFYYHKSPITPGNFTHPLFDKYELTAQPPIVGAQLIVNVVVQARDTEW